MAGGSSEGDDDLITQINVTPLVDIILVLLIIFMVTTEVIHQAERPRVIPVQLPASGTAEQMLDQGILNLVIDGQGTMYLNGDRTSYDKVEVAIGLTRARKKDVYALISADERVAHGNVAALMDFLRARKVYDIAINTKRQAIE